MICTFLDTNKSSEAIPYLLLSKNNFVKYLMVLVIEEDLSGVGPLSLQIYPTNNKQFVKFVIFVVKLV